MNCASFAKMCTKDDTLRPYQSEAKSAIFRKWDEVDNVMFQMPTGTGKTRLFTSIIKDINDFSVRSHTPVKIVVIAHRTELIDQIHASLLKYHIAHGIIAGGRERNLRLPVQVASIQTLTNRHNIEDAKKLKADFVIVDEAHHALARTYQMLWKLYPNSKKLGVTATPWRMSGHGFTDLFDDLILSWPVKKFIEKHYLSQYQYYSLQANSHISRTIEDINEFDIEGDYKVSALERVVNTGEIRAHLWDSYSTIAGGKKGIIYAVSQAHSQKICKDFRSRGVRIEAIDSKTPADERKKKVADFKRGDLDIIVNVDIFSEGFDCPDIEFVQLARPTRSLAKYLQQVGRALRPAEGKPHAIILDNVGMYSRFGLPDARRHWHHHFIGNNSSMEEVAQFIQRNGFEGGSVRNLNEGNEPMVLIQQTGDILQEETPVEVVSNRIGTITFESGYVWHEPEHRFQNGVHYFTDQKGEKFCLYPDKDASWHFEKYLPNHPEYRKVMIWPGMMGQNGFSLTCNLAFNQGTYLSYIGLNGGDEENVFDFYIPTDPEHTFYYYNKEGDEFDTLEELMNEGYIDPADDGDDVYEEIELVGDPFRDALYEARAAMGYNHFVKNENPIALVSYDILANADHGWDVCSEMNNGQTHTMFSVGQHTDFDYVMRDCESNEKPYMYLGRIRQYIKGGGVHDKLFLYVADNNGEEHLYKFDKDGNFFDEERLKNEYLRKKRETKQAKKPERKNSKPQPLPLENASPAPSPAEQKPKANHNGSERLVSSYDVVAYRNAIVALIKRNLNMRATEVSFKTVWQNLHNLLGRSAKGMLYDDIYSEISYNLPHIVCNGKCMACVWIAQDKLNTAGVKKYSFTAYRYAKDSAVVALTSPQHDVVIGGKRQLPIVTERFSPKSIQKYGELMANAILKLMKARYGGVPVDLLKILEQRTKTVIINSLG